MPQFRLGRKPARRLLSMPSLGDFLDKANSWPTVPAQGWEFAVDSSVWGMLGNDQYGNCLTGEAIVDAPDVSTGYRAPYDGPVLTFKTKSGKHLTVTPNHPMLTERGYVAAHTLKHGDNLVSTGRTNILPRSTRSLGKANVDNSPSTIQEVVEALHLGGNSVRKIVPIPVHFHGDGKFINGNIDVVTANRFLGSEFNAALCQPHAKDKISATSQLQRRFHGFCATLQGLLTGARAALGDIGSMSYSGPLWFAHAGVPQSYGLKHTALGNARSIQRGLYPSTPHAKFSAERFDVFPIRIPSHGRTKIDFVDVEKACGLSFRSDAYSGSTKSASDSSSSSAKDFRDFFSRFASLIHLDRIVDVEMHSFSGHVFNLSTDEGWYVANGIVTHNCAEAGILHLIQGQSANTGNPLTATTDQALALYTAVTGFNANDPSTDQGTVLTDLLGYIQKNGVEMTDSTGKTVTVEVVGSASLDISSIAQMRYAAYTFGGNYLGINCPQQCLDDTSNWNFAAGLPPAGGHCIPQEGEGAAGGKIISWGMVIPASAGFLLSYLEEAYCVITKSWLNAQGKSPTGLDLDGLVSAMKAL